MTAKWQCFIESYCLVEVRGMCLLEEYVSTQSAPVPDIL